jgi:tRNA nucleotidyltransferase (CCA-adding enzyme)
LTDLAAELRRSVPDAVRTIAKRLREQGFHAWLVGGSVRDALLCALVPGKGTFAKDFDLATDARPEQVQGIFRRVVPTGIQHGTVTVLIDGEGFEVTTLRAEAEYSDGRRPDAVEFVTDITADLARRDLTVNAIAFDLERDELIDPFGGLADLGLRKLRAVGDPLERFSEDGLRVLRCARFVATLEFELDPDTERAMRPSLDSYRRVSAERIRDEWQKALGAPRPSRAFEVMRRTGILEITAPELLATKDFQGALRRVDGATSPEIRLAGLLLELERPDALLSRLRFSNKERKSVAALVCHHPIECDANQSDESVRRWLVRVGRDAAEAQLALERVSIEARTDLTDEAQLAALSALDGFAARVRTQWSAPLSVRQLAVTGRDLMERLGMPPGKQLGDHLQDLLDWVLEEPARNEPERLLERVRERLSAG